MYKLVYENKEAPDGTRFNYPPINLKEMTEQEFSKSAFHSARFDYIEHRQMILKDDLSSGILGSGRLVPANLFWYNDDLGFAISSDYMGKVRFFSFGCEHSLNEKSLQACDLLLCKKCDGNIHQDWMKLIESDTGWLMNEKTSMPSRGIQDYDRVIKFSRTIVEDEQKKAMKFFQKVNCPGWTPVGCMYLEDNKYRFRTTYDSSD